jgi:two-component system nitrogen regulation sensor histidine kinase GlnL
VQLINPLRRPKPKIDASTILEALAAPVIVLGPDNIIETVNPAAEQMFQIGASVLTGMPLAEMMQSDSPLFAVVDAARASDATVGEYGISLEGPRFGPRTVSIQVTPVVERPGYVVISCYELSLASKIDRQLIHRNAARSVTAMASMLAHEVKNPLSGIRGAAQLLEQTADADDRELTRLICEEADRICALVDRMEVFSDLRPLDRAPVNIHEVLERVRRVAQNGFAQHVRFVEIYDPSLPPVHGNRDMLVQVFLNLVKNAAEAAPHDGAEIMLSTAYQHGIRLALPGSQARVNLPLVVSVQDNGGGIPEDLRAHLFDPFITTKRNGTGLGLALVAKIIGEHGGVVEFDGQPRRTVFRVMLPVVNQHGAE